jgi:hypothetical protein
MDDQENITSTRTQENSGYGSKNLIIVAVTTIVASLCYLFVPIGIFLTGRELSIFLGGLISAILSLLAMWFLPPLITAVFYEVLRYLARIEKESMYPGWFLGAIIGLIPLTGVWFLPLWNHVSPEFAAILQPFRVAPMPDNWWLMILSWLACIPAQIMGLAHLGQGKSSTDSATSQQKQPTQKRLNQHVETDSQKDQSSTNNPNNETRETSGPSPSELTFSWESAPPRRFAMSVAWMISNVILCGRFFARSPTPMLPTSGSTSRHQTASSCMAHPALGKHISLGRLLANSAIHTSS